MIEAIRKVCELQPYYSSANTAEMEERGRLIRHDIADHIKGLSGPLSSALGRFGADFHVDSSDGTGRKTELPWVRFCSKSMSPNPTDGFYSVLHFSTDGSACHVTIGCGSSQFRKGSFAVLPDAELDKRTAWARSVIQESLGTIEPFIDAPDFGARRPLPKSFERATALSKRVPVSDLESEDLDAFLVKAAEYLRLVYEAEMDGRDLSPADQDQLEIEQTVRPTTGRKRQGFGLSADDRRSVELHAMRLTREWLENEGYRVKDTSTNRPYDFEARREGEVLKVEVKGTTSDAPDAILMTRNEVELHQAEKGNTALFVVSSIRLDSQGTSRIASGGFVEAFIGWNIDDWSQTPTAFRIEKP